MIQQWLRDKRDGRKVELLIPRRGKKKNLVKMAAENASETLNSLKAQWEADKHKQSQALAELHAALEMKEPPNRIECYDISTSQGTATVGSMVVFEQGVPNKAHYRRFNIRNVVGPDDFASMREVLERYYRRLAEQEQTAADLIVVDGGAGQLSAARSVLTRYGLHSAQLIGLAKREEEIHREGEILRLPRNSAALKLLQRVRDEAHRFAITYHRLLRDQKTTASILDRIPGIGRIKKLSLLHELGSVERIRRASAAELAAVRGIGRHDVASILTFFANQADRVSDDEGGEQ